jgi:hypothetical protein
MNGVAEQGKIGEVGLPNKFGCPLHFHLFALRAQRESCTA